MKIKFWGARGSIPVDGKEYLKYGGATTCVEVTSKSGDIIVIDAGSGIWGLGNKLLKDNMLSINLIFTHSHWDHILGFPFFKPIYFKKTKLNIFGCPFAQASVKKLISKTMEPPNFPVDFSKVAADINFHGACEKDFSIGPIKISPIVLSHPNMGIGYRFTEDNKSFVFLTDNELGYRHEGGGNFDDYVKFSKDADLLVHDSEFTEEEYKRTETWGHSTYNDAFKLAVEANVKKFGLFHHNQERVDSQLDEILDLCKLKIKKEKSGLECFGVSKGMEVCL